MCPPLINSRIIPKNEETKPDKMKKICNGNPIGRGWLLSGVYDMIFDPSPNIITNPPIASNTIPAMSKSKPCRGVFSSHLPILIELALDVYKLAIKQSHNHCTLL